MGFELIINLFGLIVILFLCLDAIWFMGKFEETKFKNTLLDLDINKQYTLKKIKSIFINIYNRNIYVDELNEFDMKRINMAINYVQGNLTAFNTKYYYGSVFFGLIMGLLGKEKKYTNDKDKLLNILSEIVKELDNEKVFFGLNTREKEIFLELNKSESLSKSDLKSIMELKDIVLNRYQELIKKDEKSDRLSKRSMKLGYISLSITIFGALSTYYYSFA